MKELGVILLILFVFGFVSSAQLNSGVMTSEQFVACKHDSVTMNKELQQRKKLEDIIVLLENQNKIMPIKGLDTLKIASVVFGPTKITPFQSMLANYAPTSNFNLPLNYSSFDLDTLKKSLEGFNLVLVGIYPSEMKEHCVDPIDTLQASLKITQNVYDFLDYLGEQKNCIEVFFTNTDLLKNMAGWKKTPGVIESFSYCKLAQELSAEMIFGGIKAKGTLAESIGDYYNKGYGIQMNSRIRMKYTIPEELGLNSERLYYEVDSIVNSGLLAKAYPGCSILAAKDGKIFFKKTYGYHTYDKIIPVSEDDLYDLASVTKVTGALPAVLKLTDQGRINMDDRFSDYWTDWKSGLFHKSNKKNMTWREILAHQAGLTPYLSYWPETINNNGVKRKWYAVQPDDKYDLTVAPGMYLKDSFKKHIYRDIRKSDLLPEKKYKYSGLVFLILPDLVKQMTGLSLPQYLNDNFYKSLGAYRLTYLPLNKFPLNRTVPTEFDHAYRKLQVHGTVHDEAAATLGGISGNAGLFANTNDLAKLVEMYLQKGTYGGVEYFSSSVMDEFTKVQFPDNDNRRGLGFDKPLLNNKELSGVHCYPCPSASPSSFGHSGFTGTYIWVDPKYDLIYIFLSNRVYPTRSNTKILKMNIRTNVLQAFYDEIIEK